MGATLQIVLALLVQFGQFYFLRSRLAETAVAIEGLARYSLIIAAFACVCGGASDLLVGTLYGLAYPREAPTVGDGALGGAASGALARVVSGAAGLGISLLLMPLAFQRIQALSGGGLPGAALGPALAFSLVGGVIGGLVGIVISAILGAGLAALSGGAAAAIRSRSES